MEAQADLPEIVFAPDALGAFHGGLERGQQERGEDANDGDDDQEFHQRERAFFADGWNVFHAPERQK